MSAVMWNGGTDDADEHRRRSIELALVQGTTANDDEDDDDDDDDDSDSSDDELMTAPPARGKPEAMAARLASAARLQEKMDELEAEVVAVADDEEDDDEEDEDDDADPLGNTMETVDTVATIETKDGTTTPTITKKKSSNSKRKSSSPTNPAHPSMEDPVKPISNAEYENLEQLMIQFCRVPLLAEFSRPVALLHPEVSAKRSVPSNSALCLRYTLILQTNSPQLMTAYTKIVEHPVDLGLVCRKIRKRDYACLRDVQLDAWRIFSNCVRYHSHPSNKEAVPSFVSIALHLRNYFNSLWQEYLMPSDPPTENAKAKPNLDIQLKAAFAKRQEDRKKRLVVSGLSVMTGKSLARAADTLGGLIESGGCVDKLDTVPIFGEKVRDEDNDADIVVDNLQKLKKRLEEISLSGADYGIDELDTDVRKCYTLDVLENNPALRLRIAHRLDRWIGKIVVPIFEATCRGVSQSSVWGCMAAAVWARESSKKPYWPALVLGIMAPDHQREDWHLELTLRNESRLPEKLKTQLVTGKRKAEASLKKQKLGQMEAQSFFLVEFLGTHEFIWVREADIVEDFDPTEDPNQQGNAPAGKKKRSSRSSISNIIGSKMYASAIEEAQWALEEFELQLQDVGSDGPEEDDEGYSYPVLCQSDDEADEVDAMANKDMDVDELNELLATDGLIDFTSTGRKNAKMRAQALKKQKQDAEKKQKADKLKRAKAEQERKKKDVKSQEHESKKELRDLDKKRKKRAREREKALKTIDPTKKRKLEPEDLKKMASGRRNLIASKRERASAIVEGYLNRALRRNDYTTLCLGGVMNIPAAVIDSTGLLGMAMAFRAAAGDLPMPEESGVQSSNIKPWDAIKVDRVKTSSERMELLHKQVGLLQKEISRLKAATATRKEMTDHARQEFVEIEKKIVAGDNAARDNPLKKKMTPVTDRKQKERPTLFGEPKTPASVATSEMDAEESFYDAETTGSNDEDDVAPAYADESSADEATSADEQFVDAEAEDDAVVATAVEVDNTS